MSIAGFGAIDGRCGSTWNCVDPWYERHNDFFEAAVGWIRHFRHVYRKLGVGIEIQWLLQFKFWSRLRRQPPTATCFFCNSTWTFT